ncbi:MAG: inorganic phosphate transporter [Patescibacteria group bacterium]
MSDGLLLFLVIGGALWFDFVNGFHDAANAIATVVSTRALSARQAILLARTLNFVGALAHTAVAYTIGKGVVDSGAVTLPILLAAVMGAIGWGYLTWYFGLPSSSTHALVGGLIGVALFTHHFDFSILIGSGIQKILIAMVLSPIAGIVGSMLVLTALSWASWKTPYRSSAKFFKRLQVLSASMVSFSHGMTDAQNGMGIIAVALLAHGLTKDFHIPMWVRLASATAIGLGTSVGGWRIIRTMGTKMVKLHEPIAGCSAELTGGLVIATAAFSGAPISTTHVIATAIMGTGAARKLGNIKWRIVRQIVLAWLITFPGAALVGMMSYLFLRLFL